MSTHCFRQTKVTTQGTRVFRCRRCRLLTAEPHIRFHLDAECSKDTSRLEDGHRPHAFTAETNRRGWLEYRCIGCSLVVRYDGVDDYLDETCAGLN